MQCLKCGGEVLTVDSRHQTDGTIRRRKKCANDECGERFTTFEARCDEYTARTARAKKVMVLDVLRYEALVTASKIIADAAQNAEPRVKIARRRDALGRLVSETETGGKDDGPKCSA